MSSSAYIEWEPDTKGVPVAEWQEFCQQHGIVQASGNAFRCGEIEIWWDWMHTKDLKQAAHSLSFSTYWCGADVPYVARLALLAWAKWGGAIRAAPEVSHIARELVDAIPFVEGARRSSLVPVVSRPASNLEQWVNATPERKAAFDKEYAKAKEVEKAFEVTEEHWFRGYRSAWLSMLQKCLQALDYKGDEADHTKWIIERELAVVALRNVCAEHGDNEWANNLNLSDVIEKHLGRHLDHDDVIQQEMRERSLKQFKLDHGIE